MSQQSRIAWHDAPEKTFFKTFSAKRPFFGHEKPWSRQLKN